MELGLGLFREASPVPISANAARCARLSKIMDDVNAAYGRDSLSLGCAPDAVAGVSGTKIAFSRIPTQQEFRS